MYVDASPVSPPVSGVVAQLAKGPVDTHAGRQAVKKSTWLLRKVDALHETVGTSGQEFYPNKIDESKNLADMFTKYLKLEVWRRHVLKLLNREEGR